MNGSINHRKEIEEIMKKAGEEEIKKRLAATIAETREVEARTALLDERLRTIKAEFKREDERIAAVELENLRKEAYIAEKDKEIEETDKEIAKVRAQIAEIKKQRLRELEEQWEADRRRTSRDIKIGLQAAELAICKEKLEKVFNPEFLKKLGIFFKAPTETNNAAQSSSSVDLNNEEQQ